MGSSQGPLTIRETLDTEENQEVQDLLNLPSRKEDVVSEGIEETHDLTALIMMGKTWQTSPVRETRHLCSPWNALFSNLEPPGSSLPTCLLENLESEQYRQGPGDRGVGSVGSFLRMRTRCPSSGFDDAQVQLV